MSQRKRLYTSILVAVLLPAVPYVASAAVGGSAATQTQAPASRAPAEAQQRETGKPKPSQPSSEKGHLKTLETVVVTGVPTVSGVTVHEASFLSTTVDRQQIKRFNAVNSDDLLRIIPGVFPEPTGGKGGNNVDVAGYPAGDGLTFLTYQIEGMPVWPLYQEADVGNFEDSLIRFDDTLQTLQSVQGGPSVVSANGQPGITINMLLRQGTPTPSGEIGVTALSEGGYRVDGFAGGPLGNSGWRASFGGYILRSDGVRSPGYPADEGGQFTATLSKEFDNSSLMFYVRRLDENDQFVTDTPLLNPSAGRFAPYPTFDPLTGTFSSRENRYLFLASEACHTPGCAPGGQTYDFQEGHGAKMKLGGLSYSYFGPNGWDFAEDFQIMMAYAPEMGFFSTGANPATLSSVVAKQALLSGLQPGSYAMAGALTTSQPVGPDTMVTVQTPAMEQNRPRSISDQFKFSHDFGNGNTLSGGAYVARTQNGRYALNAPYRILLQAKSNPVPIVVSLTTPGGTVLPLTDTQGVFTVPAAPEGDNEEKWFENISALFVSDTFKIGKWVLTGGARLARDSVHGTYHLTQNTDMDDNPLTLYNNFGQVFLPATKRIQYSNLLKSGMVGATYLLTDTSSLYAGASFGVSPNHFDVIRHVPQAARVVQKTQDFNFGYKFATPFLFLSAQVYHRTFANGAAAFNLANGGTIVTFGQGQRTNGVLVQLHAGPFHGFDVALTADYNDGRIIDPTCQEFVNQGGEKESNCDNDLHPDRQPNFEYSLRPNYRIGMPFGYLDFWAVFNHIGYHTATAVSPLGLYNDLGIGAQAGIGKHWTVTLRGTNVTDEIGLTEGNARIFAGAENQGGVILARGIEGHEYNLQVNYRF